MAKRQDGRFVTLKSGRVIFIPKGYKSKWADVRDKVLARGTKRGGEVEEVPMTGGRVARIPEKYSWAKGVSEEARRKEAKGEAIVEDREPAGREVSAEDIRDYLRGIGEWVSPDTVEETTKEIMETFGLPDDEDTRAAVEDLVWDSFG